MLLFLNLKEIKAKTKDYIKQKSDLNKSLFLYLIERVITSIFSSLLLLGMPLKRHLL